MKHHASFVRFATMVLLSLLIFNCKSSQISNHLESAMGTAFYKNQFTGFMVYNPRTKDTVYSHNADRYFTPASNTKIFTLFAALQYLPEKIPALKYTVNQDTLVVKGTGDPSFLHPYFKDSTALNFLKKHTYVKVVTGNYHDEKFGPGWAWEDYDTYFSPERSAFPMYGNVLTITNATDLKTYPEVLEAQTNYTLTSKRRDFNANNFYYKLSQKDTIEVPFVLDNTLIKQLWNDLLPNKVEFTPHTAIVTDQILYSIPSDSLYKRMMHVSDNFLAEQLLILASSTVSDSLQTDGVRNSILENELIDLKQKPKWVDGSGLSRYNLFTPLSFVQVLEKLYGRIPRERLFNFFPAGGHSGTLKQWYASETQPYIYAKSGSFGNNYCLSGYLLTKSGEVLIFSFMNNHFTATSNDVKTQMQTIFEYLRDHY